MNRRRLMLSNSKESESPILYDNGVVSSMAGSFVKGFVYNTACIARDTGEYIELATPAINRRASMYTEKTFGLSKYSKLCISIAAMPESGNFYVSLTTADPELLYTEQTDTGIVQYKSIDAGAQVFEWNFRDEKYSGQDFDDAAKYHLCIYAGTKAASSVLRIDRIWLE